MCVWARARGWAFQRVGQGRGCPRPLGPQGAALRATTRWHHRPRPDPLLEAWPHPPGAPGPHCPAYLLQPLHAAGRWWSGHSQIPGHEGRRQDVKLDPAPGRCALGAARAERASYWAVASSSLGDSPGCWPRAGPGRGGRTCQPGRGAGSQQAHWAQRAGRKAPGSGFPFAQPGEASAADRERESGGLRLFLSHCSLARKEMTAGVSHPWAALHPCFVTPALPGAAASFRPRLSRLGLYGAPFPGSARPLVPLHLHSLSTVPASSRSRKAAHRGS